MACSPTTDPISWFPDLIGFCKSQRKQEVRPAVHSAEPGGGWEGAGPPDAAGGTVMKWADSVVLHFPRAHRCLYRLRVEMPTIRRL